MPEILETNVKITADASSLKKETNESVSALQRLKDAWAQTQSKVSEPVNLNTGEYSAQIAYLETRIADLKSLIESDWGKADLGSEGVLKVQAQIEQLTNQLDKLKRKQNEVITETHLLRLVV